MVPMPIDAAAPDGHGVERPAALQPGPDVATREHDVGTLLHEHGPKSRDAHRRPSANRAPRGPGVWDTRALATETTSLEEA